MKTNRSILLTLAIALGVVTGAASCRTAPVPEIAPIEGRQIDSIQRRHPGAGASPRPVVGLALGGGGLRGLAHIGVLQALEEAGIRPDLVVGTSAGALVGAAYASGRTPHEIRELAREVNIVSLIDFTLSSRGFMRGDHIAAWVDEIAGERPIEVFPIKFAAVATDLQRGVPVLLERGTPGDVVRASAAVPGVQVPVPYRDGYLVDGGISSLVPVRAARALGADIVIAVDIYCHAGQTTGLSAAAVLRQTMYTQSCLLAAPELAEADIRILPSVVVPGISNKDAQQETIQVGYEAAREALADAGRGATVRAARRVHDCAAVPILRCATRPARIEGKRKHVRARSSARPAVATWAARTAAAFRQEDESRVRFRSRYIMASSSTGRAGRASVRTGRAWSHPGLLRH